MSMTVTAPKIFVAYRTRPNPLIEPDYSTITVSASIKDEAKIALQLAEKKTVMLQNLAFEPYTGTFDEVHLLDPKTKKFLKFTYRDPAGDGQTISQAIRSYLLTTYPKCWQGDTDVIDPIVVGIQPRIFVKMLGIECSLPGPTGLNQMPLRFWYENSTHRDIEEAVMPTGFKYLNWPTTLKARGLAETYSSWRGPGSDDLVTELKLIVELAGQLGLQ